MPKYWDIIEIGGSSNKHNCPPCSFFRSKKVKATITLKGNDLAEHMKDQTLELCDMHFQQLKEAGEV